MGNKRKRGARDSALVHTPCPILLQAREASRLVSCPTASLEARCAKAQEKVLAAKRSLQELTEQEWPQEATAVLPDPELELTTNKTTDC